MLYVEVNISALKRKNLNKLADYLDASTPPPKFDMMFFFMRRQGNNLGNLNDPYQIKDEFYTECDTVACAVGHGPLAGIKAKKGETWATYAFRTLCSCDDSFDWCFAQYWADHDNTPKGAAARIRYMLSEKAVPSDTSIISMHHADAYYSFMKNVGFPVDDVR